MLGAIASFSEAGRELTEQAGAGMAVAKAAVTTASISPETPEYVTWLAVFGSDTVRLEYDRPLRGDRYGYPGLRLYKLDLRQLDTEQRLRLVHHIACRFQMAETEAWSLIQSPGVFLPERNLSIITENCAALDDWP